MDTRSVVISGARNFLAHTPGLVRHGSRPSRDIHGNPAVAEVITNHLRSFEQAAAYAPNRTYLGGLQPAGLAELDKPWYGLDGEFERDQPYGHIMPEEEFYGVMKMMDDFDLLWLEEGFSRKMAATLSETGDWTEKQLSLLESGVSIDQINGRLGEGSGNLPIYLREGELIGVVNAAHQEDASLFADVLLENLACKAAAVMAVKCLIKDLGIDPLAVPYILNSGEEAVGDRYQRGGGNLAKAIAQGCGLINSTGSDVKAFCTGPNHAVLIAAGLIAAGLFEQVIIVGGCSLAKLGMKYQGHVRNDMPILEDVLAGSAMLVQKSDGRSPVVRLDSIGKHDVGAGSAQAAILAELVSKPLERLGLGYSDVDKYATELHNPEVTEPAGSGNVPELNYKLIAALAVRAGQLSRADMPKFVARHGMPGFSPTQGHIASAIPFLPHAIDGLSNGSLNRVMFLAKGSLFLGRMTQMSDGLSFIMEPGN